MAKTWLLTAVLMLIGTSLQAHGRHCGHHGCWVGPGQNDRLALANSRLNHTGPYNLNTIGPPEVGPRPGLVSCPGPYCPGPFGWSWAWWAY